MINKKESKFMEKLAKDIIMKVQNMKPEHITHKQTIREVVSSMDTQVDEHITRTLRKSFPTDTIVSEELNPEAIGKGNGRIWVIDPICGSLNVVRGIPLFVTNIVLIENGRVNAAWVCDHSQKRVIWSNGEGKVYSGAHKMKGIGTQKQDVRLVSIDWGHRDEVPLKTYENYANMAKEIILNDLFEMCCYNSSMSFAYVATGHTEAALVIQCHPWDILAGCFLTEQNGGIVTNFDGTPWTIHTKSAIFAADRETHQLLLNLIKKNRLDKVK